MPLTNRAPAPDFKSNATHGTRRTNWFGALLVSLAIIATGISIFYFSADARREINALATANADSTQWALAQAEVELLALVSEARRADLPQDEQLENVRLRFDVYYSRIKTMRESSVLADLRENEEASGNLNDIAAVLDGMIPLIDGPDSELAAALPTIAQQMEDIRAKARMISLSGVSHFSEKSDAQRERVTSALVRLAILTLFLVAALSAVVIALVKSIRGAKRDAMEKAEVQQRMEVIVSTALDAVVVVDVAGKVIEFNDAAETVFGYSRDEIIGTPMSDAIIPNKYHDAHEIGMNRYLMTGEKRVVGKGRIQLEAKHKSGRVFPVEFSISSAQGPTGEIFVSYLRDISSRVAKQAELVSARDKAVEGERAKANLVAVMSHEMRTPLNGIIGALELLRTTDLDKKQVNMTKIMDTSAKMLLQHVNDVLDMSRLEAGAVETIQRPFNPVTVTKELLGSLGMTAKNRGNILRFEALDPKFALVMGDPAKLRQILTNLVGNAIKFTSQGTITVEIEPHRSEGTWELRVIDDGVGISEEDQSRVFDDFVTLDPSYTRSQEGTGLGLAIVRRLVGHMGGEIGVESEFGSGSIFWVKLPINIAADETPDQPVAEPAEGAMAPATASQQMNILLVEDNAINRLVAGEMLQKLGHTILEAHNGVEGVEMAAIRPFDVILMDVSMPVMDGVEATRAIRAGNGPNVQTPIIAVTAHAMPADIERFKAAGMHDVLVKPISFSRLELSLDKLPAESSGAEAAKPLIDQDIFSELRDTVGAQKHDDLIRRFKLEMDQAAKTTFAVPIHDDRDALRAEIHRLAGSASVLGAAALRDTLHHLESLLKADGAPDIGDLLKAASATWEDTKAALENVA